MLVGEHLNEGWLKTHLEECKSIVIADILPLGRHKLLGYLFLFIDELVLIEMNVPLNIEQLNTKNGYTGSF